MGGGGGHKNQYRDGGSWTVCRFKGAGVLGKKERVGVFQGKLIPQCTLWQQRPERFFSQQPQDRSFLLPMKSGSLCLRFRLKFHFIKVCKLTFKHHSYVDFV